MAWKKRVHGETNGFPRPCPCDHSKKRIHGDAFDRRRGTHPERTRLVEPFFVGTGNDDQPMVQRPAFVIGLFFDQRRHSDLRFGCTSSNFSTLSSIEFFRVVFDTLSFGLSSMAFLAGFLEQPITPNATHRLRSKRKHVIIFVFTIKSSPMSK